MIASGEVFSCQYSVAIIQFSVVSFQFSVFSCQLSVVSFKFSVVSFKLPDAGNGCNFTESTNGVGFARLLGKPKWDRKLTTENLKLIDGNRILASCCACLFLATLPRPAWLGWFALLLSRPRRKPGGMRDIG
jgi:hypothetical protein